MSSEDFAVFCNPGNHAAQILLAHLFLIEHYIDKSISSDTTHALDFRRQVMPIWIKQVADSLPLDRAPYMKRAIDLARSVN